MAGALPAANAGAVVDAEGVTAPLAAAALWCSELPISKLSFCCILMVWDGIKLSPFHHFHAYHSTITTRTAEASAIHPLENSTPSTSIGWFISGTRLLVYIVCMLTAILYRLDKKCRKK